MEWVRPGRSLLNTRDLCCVSLKLFDPQDFSSRVWIHSPWFNSNARGFLHVQDCHFHPSYRGGCECSYWKNTRVVVGLIFDSDGKIIDAIFVCNVHMLSRVWIWGEILYLLLSIPFLFCLDSEWIACAVQCSSILSYSYVLLTHVYGWYHCAHNLHWNATKDEIILN